MEESKTDVIKKSKFLQKLEKLNAFIKDYSEDVPIVLVQELLQNYGISKSIKDIESELLAINKVVKFRQYVNETTPDVLK